MTDGISIVDPWSVDFVNSLIRDFRGDWEGLLEARRDRRRDKRGELRAVMEMPTVRYVADPLWRCSPPPENLLDRSAEVAGPGVDPQVAILAMNSGVAGCVVDGEDSLCPTWANVHATGRNLWALARGALRVEKDGVVYRLAEKRAVLHYLPRGLHLTDAAWRPGGRDPACLIDAGLYAYHNARALLERGSGPYLYLPKLETEFEARFWYRVASWMEDRLEIPRWSIRFTVLVETLPALLRLEQITYALRQRLVGLAFDRWDYIFSCVKTLGYVLPDRRELTMEQPQLVEAVRWVANVARRRGCHVIGDGVAFDGAGADSLNMELVTSPMWGEVTWDGVREAARSAVVYMDAWLRGNGCVAMDGEMEGVAVAEVSRALLWGWVRGGRVSREQVEAVVRGEEAALVAAGTEPRREAVNILLSAILAESPPEFITIPAYDVIVKDSESLKCR